jgi:serine/threonine-protein kinase
MTSHADHRAQRADQPAGPDPRAVPILTTPLGGPSEEAAVPAQIGPYFVYESLGRGGMGTVRRAELRGIAGFRRVVALKQLHPHLARIPAMRALFVQEARLGSQVRHANVAQTFDFGKLDDTYYIAMEYVRGPTLAQVMRQCMVAAGPIPFPIVLGIIIQLCDALDHIHNLRCAQGQPLGIVHRDVSPPNAIISNTGIVKLIDFGIAKAETSRIHGRAGELRGKFGYSAPECVRGPIDARADLFSLGVIAYELIAGRPLFRGRDERDTLARVCEMPIPPLTSADRDVPRDLESVVMTALQRDPGLRWQSANAMRTALTEIARSGDVPVGPPQILEWVEWAFSQRASSEIDTVDARTNPIPTAAAAGGAPALPAAALPVVAVPPHELTTVVVLQGSFGSAITRVFHRDPAAAAPRRAAAAAPSPLFSDSPTRRYPRPTGDAAAAPRPRPSRTITNRRRRPAKLSPETSRARRRLRAPVMSPELGSTAVPSGLAPMRRLATAPTPAVGLRAAAAATGSARRRAARASDLGFLSTEVAALPAATPAAGSRALPLASPALTPVPLSAMIQAVPPPAQPPAEPRRDPEAAVARRQQSTGVVIVPATRRPSVAHGPTLRLSHKRGDAVWAVIASWPFVALVCVALAALVILALYS